MLARMSTTLEKNEAEIERLGRIDFRVSKELVSKPYAYINELKAQIDEEQRQIVEIVKNNNDKYLKRIAQMDQKVDRVLFETEAISHNFKKKIDGIKKDLESIRRFKEDITFSVN